MPTLIDYARTNLRVRYCFPAARILGTKGDAVGAFNHVFLNPKHVGDIAAEVAGYTVVNLVECFGHNCAPTKYCARADVIDACHNAWNEPQIGQEVDTDMDSATHAAEPPLMWRDANGSAFAFCSDTYVDDGFLQGPNVDGEGGVNHLDASVGEYESLLVHLMGEGAVSLKNLEEMVWSPAQVMCGLMHFVEAGAVGLPDGKRKRARRLCRSLGTNARSGTQRQTNRKASRISHLGRSAKIWGSCSMW